MSSGPRSRMVRVYSTSNKTDILAAKMALESRDIEYRTTGEYLSGVYPISGFADVVFYVNMSDATEARRALADLIRGKDK